MPSQSAMKFDVAWPAQHCPFLNRRQGAARQGLHHWSTCLPVPRPQCPLQQGLQRQGRGVGHDQEQPQSLVNLPLDEVDSVDGAVPSCPQLVNSICYAVPCENLRPRCKRVVFVASRPAPVVCLCCPERSC
eukprot:318897-Rhodomonas_salina.1